MAVDTAVIEAVVRPAVARLGLDLYDLRFTGSGRSRVLQVLVDRPGGVDLELVADTSQAVSRALDADDVVPGSYVLEVSSPGLERPLRTPAHFAGAVGETVSVKEIGGGETRRLRGVLRHADAECISIEVDGEPIDIRLADVTQARTVFEWGPAPASGATKQRSRS
jgi:ribosome maturation factor RimP